MFSTIIILNDCWMNALKTRTTCKWLENNLSWIIFIDALEGMGKTFVTIFPTKVRGSVTIAAESSHISPTLMPTGRTAHSGFVIALSEWKRALQHWKKPLRTVNLCQHARLIVKDVSPMISRFETVGWSLQYMWQEWSHWGNFNHLLWLPSTSTSCERRKWCRCEEFRL